MIQNVRDALGLFLMLGLAVVNPGFFLMLLCLAAVGRRP